MLIKKVIKCRKKYLITFVVAFSICLFFSLMITGNNTNELEYKNYIKPINSNKIDEEKIAYLTFDDGPSTTTEIVLDELKKADVKATFFVVGKSTAEGEQRDVLLKRIVNEGHQIGLHTYQHNEYKKIYSSSEHYVDSILKLQNEIEALTGAKSNIFRFPGGSTAKACSKSTYDEIVKKTSSLSMKFYDWNVDAQDALNGNKSADSLAKKVVSDSKKLDYPVILMHDIPTTKTSALALPEIIKQLKDDGYKFDTLNNLDMVVHQTRK